MLNNKDFKRLVTSIQHTEENPQYGVIGQLPNKSDLQYLDSANDLVVVYVVGSGISPWPNSRRCYWYEYDPISNDWILPDGLESSENMGFVTAYITPGEDHADYAIKEYSTHLARRAAYNEETDEFLFVICHGQFADGSHPGIVSLEYDSITGFYQQLGKGMKRADHFRSQDIYAERGLYVGSNDLNPPFYVEYEDFQFLVGSLYNTTAPLAIPFSGGNPILIHSQYGEVYDPDDYFYKGGLIVGAFTGISAVFTGPVLISESNTEDLYFSLTYGTFETVLSYRGLGAGIDLHFDGTGNSLNLEADCYAINGTPGVSGILGVGAECSGGLIVSLGSGAIESQDQGSW